MFRGKDGIFGKGAAANAGASALKMPAFSDAISAIVSPSLS